MFTFFTNFLTGLIVLFIAYFEVSSPKILILDLTF